MRIIQNPKFSTEVKDCHIKTVITGVELATSSKFDPLGKLTASFKKYITCQYGINISGIFVYYPDKIVGTLILNNAGLYGQEAKKHQQNFELAGKHIASEFENMLICFLDSEACEIYHDILESETCETEKIKECEKVFNGFLEDIGLRRVQDPKIIEARVARKAQKKAQKAQKRQAAIKKAAEA